MNPSHQVRSVPAVVLTLMSLACSGDQASVPLHESVGELREVMRIGAIDGAEEYLFGEISSFGVGAQGEIYVGEGGRIRAYSPDGRFLRQIAGQGAGPGEVQAVVGIAVSPSGDVAVHDHINGRLSLYSPSGDFTHHLPRPHGMPRYTRDGILFDEEEQLWVGVTPPAQDWGRTFKRPLYVRVSEEGEFRDTAYLPRHYWEECPTRSEPRFRHGYKEDLREPYVPKVKWSWNGGDRAVFGCSANFSFDIVTSEGAVATASRDWSPAGMSREEAAFVREQYGYPPERPAYHRLWLADDGRVWVWTASEGEEFQVSEELQDRGAPDTAWHYDSKEVMDVFSTEGEWIGSVRFPENWASDPFPGLRDPYFRGDTVWAVTTDSLGTSYLSRFEVEWD